MCFNNAKILYHTRSYKTPEFYKNMRVSRWRKIQILYILIKIFASKSGLLGKKVVFYLKWHSNQEWCFIFRNRGLCLMKWPSKILQNLPYFWNMKNLRRFSVFQKYDNFFWSVSLGHFINHKPHISEEWGFKAFLLPFRRNSKKCEYLALLQLE